MVVVCVVEDGSTHELETRGRGRSQGELRVVVEEAAHGVIFGHLRSRGCANRRRLSLDRVDRRAAALRGENLAVLHDLDDSWGVKAAWLGIDRGGPSLPPIRLRAGGHRRCHIGQHALVGTTVCDRPPIHLDVVRPHRGRRDAPLQLHEDELRPRSDRYSLTAKPPVSSRHSLLRDLSRFSSAMKATPSVLLKHVPSEMSCMPSCLLATSAIIVRNPLVTKHQAFTPRRVRSGPTKRKRVSSVYPPLVWSLASHPADSRVRNQASSSGEARRCSATYGPSRTANTTSHMCRTSSQSRWPQLDVGVV
jgi:hypothetical protein